MDFKKWSRLKRRKVRNSVPTAGVEVGGNYSLVVRPVCLPDSEFLCDVNIIRGLLTTSSGNLGERNAKYGQSFIALGASPK